MLCMCVIMHVYVSMYLCIHVLDGESGFPGELGGIRQQGWADLVCKESSHLLWSPADEA